MAPRAAARLETLGFKDVYEYKAGKQDWLGAGLASEGSDTACPTIAAVVRKDVPRFGLDDKTHAILESLRTGAWDWAAIVNREGILLGRVRARNIKDEDSPASAVMEEGPSTYRPNVPLEELHERMRVKGFDMALVTDQDGRLLGLVTMGDIARALDARKAS